jgi:hypothetical protein
VHISHCKVIHRGKNIRNDVGETDRIALGFQVSTCMACVSLNSDRSCVVSRLCPFAPQSFERPFSVFVFFLFFVIITLHLISANDSRRQRTMAFVLLNRKISSVWKNAISQSNTPTAVTVRASDPSYP